MARVFVMGDIHGAFRALIQCLERSGFDYEHDHLICLGDVADGWPETRRCVTQLLTISNLTYVLGNHDTWLLQWMTTGIVENIWYVQGGEASIMSYSGKPIPEEHIHFFRNAVPYYILEDRLFVHAGIDPNAPIETQTEETFLWDRVLARKALNCYVAGRSAKFTSYSEVFLGHTPISYPAPVQGGEVWMMDTGAGWDGRLSMMDVHSKEIVTSDPVPSLYPGVTGRRKG